jgi:2-hydroxychromene-2-carboxylate isomerase
MQRRRGGGLTVARVEVFYSLQSDYCYFLLDRLIGLAKKDIGVIIRPVLGGVLRVPERYQHDDPFYGQDWFDRMIWRMRLEGEAE